MFERNGNFFFGSRGRPPLDQRMHIDLWNVKIKQNCKINVLAKKVGL